jgi:signal transduction histidine kinase
VAAVRHEPVAPPRPTGAGRRDDGAERRLARLALDIHDGPVQDVAALTADVRALRDRLDAVVPKPAADALLDIQSRLAGLHTDLRDLAYGLEARALVDPPLRDVLAKQVESFMARSPIELELDLSGDLDDLTPSQRMAVARVVQEALSNVREHSGARHARVAVAGRSDALEVSVRDDGHGFEPAAAETGVRDRVHLGLAGMVERVTLLDGTLSVHTRAGGPTRIDVTIPRWRAASDGADA